MFAFVVIPLYDETHSKHSNIELLFRWQSFFLAGLKRGIASINIIYRAVYKTVCCDGYDGSTRTNCMSLRKIINGQLHDYVRTWYGSATVRQKPKPLQALELENSTKLRYVHHVQSINSNP